MKKLYTLSLTILCNALLFAGNGGNNNAQAGLTPLNQAFYVTTPAQNDTAANRIASDVETVSINPNPVRGLATITFHYPNVDRISILNIVGREVKSFTPEPGYQEIRVSLIDLQPGVYFLAVYYNGSNLITKKFLKEE